MISSTFDKNKVFTVMWSEIEGRIDPSPYCSQRRAILHQVNCLKCDKKQLKHLCSFISDRTNDLTKIERYIGLENISGLINDFIGKNQIKTINGTCGIAQKGDLLYAKLRPYLNKVMITDCSSYTSTEIVILRNKSEVLTKYLLAYLTSDLVLNQTKYIMTGNTLPRLQLNDIKNFVIPILPLEIQSKIVQIFEDSRKKYFSKLSQVEELLKSIDTYLLSELNLQLPELKNDLADRKYIVNSKEVLGRRFDPSYHSKQYELFVQECSKKNIALAKLKDISFNIYQGVGRCLTEDKSNILLKVKNILPENQIDYFDVEFIDNPPKNKQLQVGDIISPFIGEAIRQFKFSIFNNNNGNYFVDNNTGVIRVKNGYDGLYVCAILNSSIMKFQIERLIGGGVPFIGTTGAKELLIPIVDFQVQSKIAFHIQQVYDKIKNLKIEAQQCLDLARTQIEQIILGE